MNFLADISVLNFVDQSPTTSRSHLEKNVYHRIMYIWKIVRIEPLCYKLKKKINEICKHVKTCKDTCISIRHPLFSHFGVLTIHCDFYYS